MKSELSAILRIKLVAQNIVFGSPGNHFMHMSVKSKRTSKTSMKEFGEKNAKATIIRRCNANSSL